MAGKRYTMPELKEQYPDKWVILDGIESAQPELFERLISLCDITNRNLNLYEKGPEYEYTLDNKNPKFRIHKNFRLFITYNPVEIEQSKKLTSSFLSNCLTFSLSSIDRDDKSSALILSGLFSYKKTFEENENEEENNIMENIENDNILEDKKDGIEKLKDDLSKKEPKDNIKMAKKDENKKSRSSSSSSDNKPNKRKKKAEVLAQVEKSLKKKKIKVEAPVQVVKSLKKIIDKKVEALVQVVKSLKKKKIKKAEIQAQVVKSLKKKRN